MAYSPLLSFAGRDGEWPTEEELVMEMLPKHALRAAIGRVLARWSAWRLAHARKAVEHDPNARAGVDAARPVGSGLFGALVSNS